MARSELASNKAHGLAVAILLAGCSTPRQRETVVVPPRPPQVVAEESANLPASTVSPQRVQPVEYEFKDSAAMSESLKTVGEHLADSFDEPGIEFHFEALSNTEPRVHHSRDGHIYVTTGLLGRLNSEQDLAGILALEMSECIEEREQRSTPPLQAPVPSMGASDEFLQRALASKTTGSAPAPTQRQIDKLAKKMLREAGYASVDIKQVRERFEALQNDADSASSME
jgi:predicted Zn-dependent protease